MRMRIGVGLAAVAAGLVALTGGPDRAAAQPKLKNPAFAYGHDLRVRPGGTKNFGPTTPKVGVEVYLDENNGAAVAITEAGFVAVAPAPKGSDDKAAQWLTAHDVPVRKGAEASFTQQTKKFGVEVFRDGPSGRLLYATEASAIALSPDAAPAAVSAEKGPKWHHALDLKARTADDDNFEKAKKFGVEAYKDEATGLLMYVTETGAIAVGKAPDAAPERNKVRPPKHLFGLILQVRGADEKDFSEKTKRVAVEVFEDPNTGWLAFLSDAGSIAVAPKPAELKADAKGVSWKNGLTLNTRKGGEKDWAKGKKYGVEVFQEPKTGYLIYASETGAISVLPPK